MKLLALDLALRSTGWAVGFPGMNRPHWGRFRVKDWKGNEEHHVLRFWEFLTDLHETHQLTHIAYEDVFVSAARFQHNGTQGQQFFVALILLFIKLNGLGVHRVPISTWRAHFVPGSPPKGMTSMERRKWWKRRSLDECVSRGWDVAVDDEAEALGIMDFAIGAIDPHHAGATDPIFHAVAP